jgi:molecular chaperone DnaK
MREPVVGIDLGTSTSAVATMENGRPLIIKSRAGFPLTPSLVGFLPTGDRVIGHAARELAEAHPESVAAATKRFIGRHYSQALADEAKRVVSYPLVEGPAGEVRVAVADRILPVTQVGAMILGELKLDAQAYFGRPVNKAVITVPANFNDSQRQATREAAQIAGLEVLRMVNEPTAAAVAYGLTTQFQGRALIFDLGGGTFDVSILEVENGVFQVKATGGDPFLGGEDFDNRIVEWLIAQIPEPFKTAVAQDKVSLQRLRVAAEGAKRELSTAEEVYLSVPKVGDHLNPSLVTDLDTALTRKFFEALSEPLSRRCIAVCERVMAEARMSNQEVDTVLLVGGMTRVPLIRRLVKDFFGKEPFVGVNPDEAVALGAAVHAAELHSTETARALLLDVASHALGVGTLGGGMRRLVKKNTAIPVVAKETFVPGQNGQREARIPIYQGDSEVAQENSKLGELVLRGLSAKDRHETPLEVTFELSSEGMLQVRAVDLTTGQAEAIKLEARPELSGDELKRLEEEQRQYASTQSKEDEAKAVENFQRLLGRGEKLAVLLSKSAQENPGPEAQAAVANVQALLDLGRAAHRARNLSQIAELGQKLTQLVK